MNLKIVAWAAGRIGLLQINSDMSSRENQEDETSMDVQGASGSVGEGSGQRYKYGDLST